MDSPGRLDTVLDDSDFLLELAEAAADERLGHGASQPAQPIHDVFAERALLAGGYRAPVALPQHNTSEHIQCRTSGRVDHGLVRVTADLLCGSLQLCRLRQSLCLAHLTQASQHPTMWSPPLDCG